jgi:hypothetical protein
VAIVSPPTNPREHGTDRGFEQHRRRGEPACDPCKKAHSVRVTEWRRNHRRDDARPRTIIPTELLGKLYLTADPKVQEETELTVRSDTLNRAIRYATAAKKG